MKKKIRLLFAALFLTALLNACGASGAQEPADARGSITGSAYSNGSLAFITGSPQGTYYALGNILAKLVNAATDTAVTVLTSDGSEENLEAVRDGDAQIGFLQSDMMAYAYKGTGPFDAPISGFSTLAALYTEEAQIVTLNPNLTGVADLKGKTVSVSNDSSGSYYVAKEILELYGLNIETDINLVYESFGASADSLQEGKVDAAFIVAGAPTNAVTSLAVTGDVYLIPFDDAHINDLVSASPYYTPSVIPAATYNLRGDVTTVAVRAVVIARDNVTDEDAYNFVSGVFENLDAVSAAHAKGAEFSLAFGASVTAVPYHPGAARYFAEKGYDAPVKE